MTNPSNKNTEAQVLRRVQGYLEQAAESLFLERTVDSGIKRKAKLEIIQEVIDYMHQEMLDAKLEL